ncbi:hypothetical protein PybrP1_009673 [[Pythium] brassicae (nom. inval.)]|nr:hypothetical protein PybrP1_009673 [[Pythium] brassicae (nom. inval.)]
MAKRGRVIVERRRKNARQRVEETKDSDSERSATDSEDEQPRATAPADDDDDAEESEHENDSDTLDFTQPDYALQVSESQVLGDSEDNGEATRTKASAMPARVAQLSAKNVEDLTALLVRYMLYKASLKLPIKFVDISKDVFPKYKNVSRYFFQKAKQQLESVFGYRVIAVDESATKELYIVLNAQTSQEHLLLMNKNGKGSALALLDPAIKPTRDHPQLGDVTTLLKTFENQLYLHATSEIDADLKKIKFYAYGARALLEVGKVQILNFVCKVSVLECA